MIQAHNPMIIGDAKNIAVTFENGNKILSLSLDNSCGRMEKLSRGSILLMIEDATGNSDVTDQVFDAAADGHVVHANLGNFEIAMNWLNRCEWGMDLMAAK